MGLRGNGRPVPVRRRTITPMITQLTGRLNRILDEEVRLQAGPFEYQVMVSESVRRQLQLRAGDEITLHISEYLEGNSSGNRFVPRMLGFTTERELEFFDLLCTVDKIGVKKALKAMSRPVKEIADAITRQDAKWLTTLPGIGASTAEQIVTTLKRKVAGLAFSSLPPTSATTPDAPAAPAAEGVDAKLIDDVYQALMALGQSPIEARTRLDQLLQSGKPFTDVPSAITILYARG
jgi:holliday junction DNA helicase RuvA